MLVLILFLSALFLITLLVLRIVQLRSARQSPRQHRTLPARTMIVLGSGGHTAEMLQLAGSLDRTRYTPRIYVVAETDKMSLTKVIAEEAASPDYRIIRVPRSREVRQSYASAVLSTGRAVWAAVPLVWREQPDLVLTNGPGTCVPIVAAAAGLRLLGRNQDARLVFVESFCRVKNISLSGKILQWLVDLFVVQWPGLTAEARGAKYLGKLM